MRKYHISRLLALSTMSTECKESLRTVELVRDCPKDRKGWDERAKLKDCPLITNNTRCNGGKLLEYHCLPNPFRTQNIEVCAPRTNIPSDTCAEYNSKGKRINGAYNCSKNIGHLCPKTQYWSTDITSYRGCFLNLKNEDQKVGLSEGWMVGIFFITLFAFSLIFIAIYWYKCKRSNVNNLQLCTDPVPIRDLEEGNPLSNEIRILILGRTGNGKSSTGNTILNRYEFEAALSATSVTNKCVTAETEIGNDRIIVIDTPGLFDTNNNDESIRDMLKLCEGGLHAIVIVLQAMPIQDVDIKIINNIKRTFKRKTEKDFKMYATVLFTKYDALKRENKTLKSFLSGPGKNIEKLQRFISKCNNKETAFDNTFVNERKIADEKDYQQVHRLLDKIKENVQKLGPLYLTSNNPCS